jgi:hypothetical protein
MSLLLKAFLAFAIALNRPAGMQPRILLGGPWTSPSETLTVKAGHLITESGVVHPGTPRDPRGVEVTWDEETRRITPADEKNSEDWMKAHSLLPRLKIKHKILFWDGKKVDLGKISVTDIYQAIPWQGGVLIYGRTYPKRGFFQSWPFKGAFIEARDMEPYCAIFFDPQTLKGEDLWLNGKVIRSFFVFPLPQ